MTCKELIDFLDRYVSSELATDLRDRFDEHLDICPDCRDYLDSYRKTIRLGHESCCGEGDGPPEGMPEDMVAAILAALGKRPDGGGSPD